MSQVKVTVFKSDSYGSMPTDNLVGFVAWVNEQVAKIPPEYVASASIDIESDSYYESTYPTIEIYYYRPLTAEEIAADEARARIMREKAEAKERWEYERLAKKYGGP